MLQCYHFLGCLAEHVRFMCLYFIFNGYPQSVLSNRWHWKLIITVCFSWRWKQ